MRGRKRGGQAHKIGRVLERRIDQDEAAAFLRRQIGAERRPAVDGKRFGAGIAAERGGQRGGGARLKLTGDQAILPPQQSW